MKNNVYRSIINKISHWLFNTSTITLADKEISFCYVVKYSTKVCNHSETLPMLIALHGDGGEVDSFYNAALDTINVPARIILIVAPISHEMGNVWPYSATQFLDYGKVFSEIVDKLSSQFPTTNKPILLGFSGGGTMAYYQAVKHGDSYSCIFPVSGLLFKEQLRGKSSEPSAKIYAYHGKKDEVVPFSAGLTAVKLLKNKGVNVKFTEFDGGHHGLVSEMKSEIILTIEKKLSVLSGSSD